MSTLGAVVYAKNMITDRKSEEKKIQVNKDMLHLLSYLQAFIDANCPEVSPQLKIITSAVRKSQRKNSAKIRD